MIIEKEIIVNKNIENAWKVLGIEFADAWKWASAVNHSEGTGPAFNGATCSERGCATSMGKLKEKLLKYAPQQHTLTYQVAEGMPSMVKYATNSWTLTATGPEQSKLHMRMDIQTSGILGVIMQPMMKMQMSKMGNELLDDFKYFLEKGQPHPRKVKAMQRYKK